MGLKTLGGETLLDTYSRGAIIERIGNSIDELVSDLYSDASKGPSIIQEPEITSRICQRLEDRINNSQAGEYIIRVTAQSLPDRGPKSLEKIIGADLFIAFSLEGPDGFDKGIFIQAKYDRNINKAELQDACDRMKNAAGPRGGYVWIYEADGVRVISPYQVDQMTGDSLNGIVPRKAAGFVGRILDCHAGSREWGITGDSNRRQIIETKLRATRAKNVLDIDVVKADRRHSRRR